MKTNCQLSILNCQLKRGFHPETDTALLDAGMVAVSQTPDVIKAKELEDVFNPHTHLHIRRFVKRVGTFGETIESFRIQSRIVFVNYYENLCKLNYVNLFNRSWFELSKVWNSGTFCG